MLDPTPRRRPVPTLDAVYAETRSCIPALRSLGHTGPAEVLDTALSGSTSGEILTNLGVHLSATLGSRTEVPADLRSRLASLLADVNSILRSAGQR